MYCEQKISENPEAIFYSKSFLSCGSNVLRRILQLEFLSCDESLVFDRCMAWATAACIQKNLDETNMLNLWNELGDLFYEIIFWRYGNREILLTVSGIYFRWRVQKHHRYDCIHRNGRTKNTEQGFNGNNNELVCDRSDPNSFDKPRHYVDCKNYTFKCYTIFSSNR